MPSATAWGQGVVAVGCGDSRPSLAIGFPSAGFYDGAQQQWGLGRARQYV